MWIISYLLICSLHIVLLCWIGCLGTANEFKLNESGELFGDLLGGKHMEAVATFEDAKSFMHWLDKVVTKMPGARGLGLIFKHNPEKLLIDVLTDMDMAMAVLMQEGYEKVWDEREHAKKTCDTKAALKAYQYKESPKYHVKAGVKLQLYGSGWTQEGEARLNQLAGKFAQLREDMGPEGFWTKLKEHWKQYAKAYSHWYHEKKGVPLPVGEDEIEDDESDDDEGEVELPGDD